MEIQKVKISDLPVTEDLNGLKTLGTTAENTSKAAELTFIADAATSANEAATNANQAAKNANTSSANADAKAEAAQKAADNATASANQADQAAVNANTATTRATAAAEKAENAADVAIGVVNEAQQATANANQAAQSANEAATSANDAATEAHTQAEYAKTQGDYAKAEGDRVLAEKGQPGGLAELDENGRVPSSQLPSYVDDVINVATYSQLPNPGESGKIYITEDTNLTYRWSGTGYAEISPSLALGTTAETAGRGDWTQAAYNHSLIKDGSNPHKTTFASLPDKPTSLPANGGNADTVDNLHASSFTRADQAPNVDLNTVNGQGIMACGLNEFATAERHYPIQQAGTLFYGTAAYGSACQIYGTFQYNRWFVRGGGTSQTKKTAWAEIWTTVNFNPSSFAQIKSYTYPSGGVNNITDLDFTGNIQAHFPGAEYSCIWQGKDFAGTILQLKLRDYAGKQFMMYRGSLTKIWRTVWDSGNFNPDNKFGLSGIISDLNNAPLNAVFSTNGTPANAPLENAYFQGFTFAMDNNPDFKRQWAFKDKKIWFRNLHAGSWSAWTDVIPLDNYLPLSGNKTITGNVALANEVMITNQNGGNLVGFRNSLSEFGDAGHATRIVSNDSDLQHWRGGQNTIIYDSSNLGNATTSKAGLMSAADKTKLDGLSGGGLNIPASGEVAISGWMYNGKQVYAQRWTGEFTGVTKNLTTIEGLSAILMKGGTLFLYGSQSNSVGLGSSQWNQTTGDITRISDLQYNLSTGSVTVAAWYGGTSSPTTVNWSYEVWAAYTK
jgi:hypothetical protein